MISQTFITALILDPCNLVLWRAESQRTISTQIFSRPRRGEKRLNFTSAQAVVLFPSVIESWQRLRPTLGVPQCA